MKKYFPILCIILFFFSCNSADKKKDESIKTDSKSESAVGVQNVNGNIPDTTNTINIGTHKPNEGSDSLSKDSLKK